MSPNINFLIPSPCASLLPFLNDWPPQKIFKKHPVQISIIETVYNKERWATREGDREGRIATFTTLTSFSVSHQQYSVVVGVQVVIVVILLLLLLLPHQRHQLPPSKLHSSFKLFENKTISSNSYLSGFKRMVHALILQTMQECYCPDSKVSPLQHSINLTFEEREKKQKTNCEVSVFEVWDIQRTENNETRVVDFDVTEPMRRNLWLEHLFAATGKWALLDTWTPSLGATVPKSLLAAMVPLRSLFSPTTKPL